MMTLTGYVTQVGLTSLGTAGVLYGAGRFIFKKSLDKYVDFHFKQRLEKLKAQDAQLLAQMAARWKLQADSQLEAEKSDYAARLEKLKSDLQGTMDERIEELRNQNASGQEKIKADLNIRVQELLELFKLRRVIYPRLVELMYRTRNKAREAFNLQDMSQLTKDLHDLVNQIIESMFQSRAYLEHDGTQVRIHTFKNLGESFVKALEIYESLRAVGKQKEADEIRSQLEEIYQKLDGENTETIALLQSLVVGVPSSA
jgi:hypothetical protein